MRCIRILIFIVTASIIILSSALLPASTRRRVVRYDSEYMAGITKEDYIRIEEYSSKRFTIDNVGLRLAGIGLALL